MSDPFLGEIRAFTWQFAPRGWAYCNGALMAIGQNTALFALLGTYYGGNGTSNFALPDLRGRTPLHFGTGTDGIDYVMGEQGGQEQVTLTQTTMPQHNHLMMGRSEAADKAVLSTYLLAQAHSATTAHDIYGPYVNVLPLASGSTSMIGGNLPHANVQPFIALNFCIAIQGIFPSRS